MKYQQNQTGASAIEWLLLLALVSVIAMAMVSIISDNRPIFDTQPRPKVTTTALGQGG